MGDVRREGVKYAPAEQTWNCLQLKLEAGSKLKSKLKSKLLRVVERLLREDVDESWLC
jgi:hypothetical protein